MTPMAGNIQRSPDGKWRARYRGANHREHARHFARKRDAERWLASQEVAIARGGSTRPLSKITVGEWLPQWLARQVKLEPTMMVRWEVAVRRQILPRWELVPLAKITQSDVSSWVHRLTDEGLAPATVRFRPSGAVPCTHSRSPRRTLGEERRQGRTSPNLSPGEPKRFVTHEQVQAMAEACAQYGTLIKVLAYAGLR
jgi:hypothetical protein